MFIIFEAILPIFLLVLLGAGFRRWQFPGPGFWSMADRITYYVFLPSLIIEKLATSTFTLEDFNSSALVLIISIFVVATFLVTIRKILPVNGPAFTSVFQGSIRPNTYVALAAAAAIYGSEGLVLTAVILAGAVPLVNVLCVASFNFYVPVNGRSGHSLVKGVVTNPLVIACLIGIFLNSTHIGLPFVSQDFMKILASAALPMGLISVGFGLQLRGLNQPVFAVIFPTILKLVILPAVVYLTLLLMDVGDIHYAISMLFASVPCAASSYILSGQLNGDQKLMATIITIETLIAFITMPIILALAPV